MSDRKVLDDKYSYQIDDDYTVHLFRNEEERWDLLTNPLIVAIHKIEELEAQIDEMKKELHHRLISPSKSDSDCLDKIIGLDRLWQFGKEF